MRSYFKWCLRVCYILDHSLYFDQFVTLNAFPKNCCKVHFLRIRSFTTLRRACLLLSRVWLSAAPWTAACQAPLALAKGNSNMESYLKFIFTEWVMLSNRLIFCRPLLLLPLIFPRIRVSSSVLALHQAAKELRAESFSMSPQWIFRVVALFGLRLFGGEQRIECTIKRGFPKWCTLSRPSPAK